MLLLWFFIIIMISLSLSSLRYIILVKRYSIQYFFIILHKIAVFYDCNYSYVYNMI